MKFDDGDVSMSEPVEHYLPLTFEQCSVQVKFKIRSDSGYVTFSSSCTNAWVFFTPRPVDHNTQDEVCAAFSNLVRVYLFVVRI